MEKDNLLIHILEPDLDSRHNHQLLTSKFTSIYRGKLIAKLKIFDNIVIVSLFAQLETKIKTVKTENCFNDLRVSEYDPFNPFHITDFLWYLGSIQNFNCSHDSYPVSIKDLENIELPRGKYRNISVEGNHYISTLVVNVHKQLWLLEELLYQFNDIVHFEFDPDELLKYIKKIIDIDRYKHGSCDFCGGSRYVCDVITYRSDYYDVGYHKEGSFCEECYNEALHERSNAIDLMVSTHNDSFKRSKYAWA